VSDWNDFLEAKLALDLTVEEHRLADALARNLLGFARREDRIGDRLLMQQARFSDRRSLVKARDGLAAKGLLTSRRRRPQAADAALSTGF
jgi:hypothetical protein